MVAPVGGAARARRVAQRGGVAVVLVQGGEGGAAGAGLPLRLLAVAVLKLYIFLVPRRISLCLLACFLSHTNFLLFYVLETVPCLFEFS